MGGRPLITVGFEPLAARLTGDLLTAGQAGYDDERKVFNGMIDRRPAAIALCASVADVRHALEFGRRQELRSGPDGLPPLHPAHLLERRPRSRRPRV